MTLNIEYTKNGKPNILFNNYKYRESYSVKNGDIVWRCLGRTCGATIRTDSTRTAVTESNSKHTGPHPVTMRSLSSPLSSSGTSTATPETPSGPSAAEPVANRASAPSRSLPDLATPTTSTTSAHTLTASSTPVDSPAISIPLMDGIEMENKKLNDEISKLKGQLKVVLDHSIESNLRLLEYTDQVFVPNSSLEKRITDPLTIDCGVQCDIPAVCEDERCAELRSIITGLRTTIEVLEIEKNKRKTDFEESSSAKASAEIIIEGLKEEIKDMVESIKNLKKDLDDKNKMIDRLKGDGDGLSLKITNQEAELNLLRVKCKTNEEFIFPRSSVKTKPVTTEHLCITSENRYAPLNELRKVSPLISKGNCTDLTVTINTTPKQMQNVTPPPDQRQGMNGTQRTHAHANKYKKMKGIQVLEADMKDLINEMKSDSSVAFAHTISGDFHHPRQMTAGVAVVFRKIFGKPSVKECVTKHLACQRVTNGATVFSLITKATFDGKPTTCDYGKAFQEFTYNFKKTGCSMLVCSPMGCVRDLIKLSHFARNIQQFHRITGATVLIITKEQKASRVLRQGLSQAEFVKQLREEITKAATELDERCDLNSRLEKPEVQKSINPPPGWFKLSDDDMKLYLDKLTIPDNAFILDPAVSHLVKNSENKYEYENVIKSCALDSYDYVLAPVNNRINDAKEGGGHWSLLLFVRSENAYYHLDSLEPHNQSHAEQLAARLSGDPQVNVRRLRCVRQKHSVECGAYVLQFAELMCSLIRNKLAVNDDCFYIQQFSLNKIYTLINAVKSGQKKDKTLAKQKIVVMTDSHGYGLSHLIECKVDGRCEMFSVVKSGAPLENVTSGLDNEISKLGKSDHLVILGGTNDIESKTTVFDVKQCIAKIASKAKQTNVFLCTIPLRYDRPDLNCTIRRINIDLVMESLKYDNFTVVSLANIPRTNFTSHGLHLNVHGKDRLSFLIATKINETNCLN